MFLSFLIFIFSITLLFLTSQALIKYLLKLTHPYFVFFLLLPGILLHELSHLFMATILNVKTGHLTLKPELKNNQLSLGSAQIQKTNSFKFTLIGIAPFLTASFSLYSILIIGLHLNLHQLSLNSLSLVFSLPSKLLFLFFYLIFVFSVTMFSSQSDLQLSTIPLIFIILVASLFYFTSLSLPFALIDPITNLLYLFSLVFFTCTLINLIILLPLKLIYQFMLH